MSGIEAAGLVLGSLPLLIAAIEHYEDVLRPIRRYRKYTSKVQRFCDEFEGQRTVFHTECQLLLGVFVDMQTAKEMLGDPIHPSWRDEDLCLKFGHRLGMLGTSCMSTISTIDGKLTEIGVMFQQFTPDVSGLSDGDQVSAKDWLRARKKKLKFAFSEGTLKSAISDLRTLNQDFRVKTSQILQFDAQYARDAQQPQRLSYPRRAALKKFQMVRNASCQLYESLCRACTSHPEHLAKFCLEATCEDPSLEVGHPQISFRLAYVPVPSGKSLAMIDSTISEASNQLWSESSKWFEVESIMQSQQDVYRVRQNALNRTPSLQNQDFCVQLQTTMSKRDDPSLKSLVVVLEDADLCKHSIYYPSVRNPPALPHESTSLKHLLSPNTGHHIGNIPQLYRIRIARSLAIAVLQFHTTPWLSKPWQSENVLFSKAESDDWNSYIPSPHLLVRVTTTDTSPIAQSTSPMNDIVPNTILFELGIMLLELAYGLPFALLLRASELNDPIDPKLGQFSGAKRLANNVGVYFGAGYANVVRKCLRCDFGEGDDLGSTKLQERLFEDVICRLEELENGMLKSQGAL